MNSALIIFLFLIFLLTNITWGYFFFIMKNKEDKRQKEMFREYVIASKATTLSNYTEALPEEGPVDLVFQDEIADLDKVDPEQLLKAIQAEDEDN